MDSNDDESKDIPRYNQHSFTIITSADEDYVIRSHGIGLPLDQSGLPLRSVGDSDGEEDLSLDPSLFLSVEDLEETASVEMFLRDVPSPSRQLLDDDRPQFTSISKVSGSIDHFRSSIITPTAAAAHHEPSPSLTAQETCLVQNASSSYLLESSGSNVSTQYIHGVSIAGVDYVGDLEIKGTVSPLSVESEGDNAKIMRSFSRTQLSCRLFTMGLVREEFVDEGVGLTTSTDRKRGPSTAREIYRRGKSNSAYDYSRSSVSVTTTATVGVLLRLAMTALSLMLGAVISVTSMVGSMIASVIMMYIYIVLAPWRWTLSVLQIVLALPRWFLSR